MITFVAALRHNKMMAPMVLDGPINGASFVAYIEHVEEVRRSPSKANHPQGTERRPASLWSVAKRAA